MTIFSTIVTAEIIKNIEVEGNERISKDTIIMFSEIKIGDEINVNTTNQILNNIYKTNFFKDVKVSFKNEILTIAVEENPIIENITLNGIKAKKINKVLRQNLKLKSRSSYNELLIEQDSKEILNQLRIKPKQ